MSEKSTCFVVTGAAGQLGSHIVRQLLNENSGEEVVGIVHNSSKLPPDTLAHPNFTAMEMDLLTGNFMDVLSRCKSKSRVVINCAAISNVQEAYQFQDRAVKVNSEIPRRIAEAVSAASQDSEHPVLLLHLSTDMVFNGTMETATSGGKGYKEDDQTCPLSVYGKTKVDGEKAVLEHTDRAVVCRMPLMYGAPHSSKMDSATFVKSVNSLSKGEEQKGFEDEFRTPLSLLEASRLIIGIAQYLLQGKGPLPFRKLHVAGPERLSRQEMIEDMSRCVHQEPKISPKQPSKIVPVKRDSVPGAEPRPGDLSLNTELLQSLPLPEKCKPLGHRAAVAEALRHYLECTSLPG